MVKEEEGGEEEGEGEEGEMGVTETCVVKGGGG